MRISCTVDRTIFLNPDNGYHVLSLFSEDEGFFTAKGYLPEVKPGQILSIEGDFVNDVKYGKQFNINSFNLEAPTDNQGIYDYLTSGLIKGVGPKTAELLVDRFGVKTLEIIEKYPESLRDVPGIGKKTAEKIVQSHLESKDMQELISFCSKYKIPIQRAIKLYSIYRGRTIDIIKNNPYSLIEEVHGISFKKADEMALSLDIDKYSSFRISAGILYVLSEYAQSEGHTCVPRSLLIERSLLILSFEPEYDLTEEIDNLISAKKIIKTVHTIEDKDVDMLSLAVNFFSEFGISREIKRLILNVKSFSCEHGDSPTVDIFNDIDEEESFLAELNSNSKKPSANNVENIKSILLNEGEKSVTDVGSNKNEGSKLDSIMQTLKTGILEEKNVYYENKDEDINTLRSLIDGFERANKVELDSTQKDAIVNSFFYGVSVISGGPGTGKTTIINCINYICEIKKWETALAAPTGRASKRMTEATGKNATTIHRLLGVSMGDKGMVFEKNKNSKLTEDVIIIDEISMADIYIFYSLIQAVKTGARLILVGDQNQLPSVSAGNILADLIACKKIKVSFLTKIYRQDEKSLIVYNAHKVNSGKMPDINNLSEDFFFLEVSDVSKILSEVVSQYTTRISSHFKIGIENIQILCPIKRTQIGTENINRILQEYLVKNPLGTQFEIGDKVMHIKNNYNIEWQTVDGQKGNGIFNGELGYVKKIDNRSSYLVEFEDGKIASYTKDMAQELMLAYAISVHKSQGSEFDAVILVLGDTKMPLLNRNLLYTALTRAKKMIAILGTKNAIKAMIKNNYIAKRYTQLEYFLFNDDDLEYVE